MTSDWCVRGWRRVFGKTIKTSPMVLDAVATYAGYEFGPPIHNLSRPQVISGISMNELCTSRDRCLTSGQSRPFFMPGGGSGNCHKLVPGGDRRQIGRVANELCHTKRRVNAAELARIT